MAAINSSHLREMLSNTVGPAPWYWQTFPSVRSRSGQRLVWSHHGEHGPIGHVVTLGAEGQPARTRLALNTYCRPFFVPPHFVGVWCPEGQNIRLTCFDPDQLQEFDLAEVAGWFKQSSDRIYAASAPIAEFEVPLSLASGTHKIDVPAALQSVDELIVPTSYKAMSNDDPAFALFILYLQAGLVEVLPQKWFTAAQYSVGRQWITRAARDSASQRLFGECYGVGTFLLEEDGCRLTEWISAAQ